MKDVKPHGKDRPECGSIIGYQFVPLSVIITEYDKWTYALGSEAIKKIEENTIDFETCKQTVE